MVLDVFLVLLIAAGGVGVVWWFHRPAYKQRRIELAMEVRKSTAWGQFTGALVRRWNMTVLPWLRRMWRRFMRRADPAGMKPMSTGGPPRPVPRAAHPLLPDSPAPVAAPVLPDLPTAPAVDTAITGAALSPAQAAVVAETGSFEPEDDAEMIAHFRREIAFQDAHANAFRSMLDHLLHAVRADPSSVHGISEYADVRADSAHDAAGMLRRYLTVYAEIKEFRANGGVLPVDGDWITPEGA